MYPGLKVLASVFRELDPFVLTAVLTYIDGCIDAGATKVTIGIYENATQQETLVDLPTVGVLIPVVWVSSGAITYEARDLNCQWKIAGVCADRIAFTPTHTLIGVSK